MDKHDTVSIIAVQLGILTHVAGVTGCVGIGKQKACENQDAQH
jgi:hypothetical protein